MIWTTTMQCSGGAPTADTTLLLQVDSRSQPAAANHIANSQLKKAIFVLRQAILLLFSYASLWCYVLANNRALGHMLYCYYSILLQPEPLATKI